MNAHAEDTLELFKNLVTGGKGFYEATYAAKTLTYEASDTLFLTSDILEKALELFIKLITRGYAFTEATEAACYSLSKLAEIKDFSRLYNYKRVLFTNLALLELLLGKKQHHHRILQHIREKCNFQNNFSREAADNLLMVANDILEANKPPAKTCCTML